MSRFFLALAAWHFVFRVGTAKFYRMGLAEPYEQVSAKSVEWLKSKVWSVQVAFQAPWSGQNTTNIVMDRQGLLKSRGVERNGRRFRRARRSTRLSSRRSSRSGTAAISVHVAARQEHPGQGYRDPQPEPAARAGRGARLAAEEHQGPEGQQSAATIGIVTAPRRVLLQMALQMNGLIVGKT